MCICFHHLYRIPDFLARLAPNAGLGAPVVTVGALLIIWSVAESESHIQKTLLKLIRNPIFSVYALSHRRFWGAIRASGAIWGLWSHLESSGVICSYLELSGPIWRLWSHLESSGAVWSHLQSSGAIWSYLDISGGIWSLLDS